MNPALVDCVFGGVEPDSANEPAPRAPKPRPAPSSEWRGWRDKRVHPDAPDGGGGFGGFGFGILGRNEGLSDPEYPNAHPRSPAGRYLVADAGLDADVPEKAPAIPEVSDFGGGGGTTTAKKKKPPPKTKAGKVAVTIKQPTGVVCDISVEILDDTVDKDADSEGVTKCSWKPDRKIDPPVPVYDTSSGLAIVSSITKGAKATAVLVIQTTYQKSGLETQISGYGRGTTRDDKNAGNVTLGFHESCHRNDFIEYLNTQKLPDFDGGPGTVNQEFNDHWQAFMDAFLALPKTMQAWSGKRTDDVGTTKATWEAAKKKKASPAPKH